MVKINKDNQYTYYTNLYGDKFWYFDNLLHREDGPALEYANGDKAWYFHGKLHRLDGPAINWRDGYNRWYYYGERVNCSSKEQFERLIKLKYLW